MVLSGTKVRTLLVLFLWILVSGGTAGARDRGDAEIGKQKFRKCLKCHEISPGAKGPNLVFADGEFRTPVEGQKAIPHKGPIPGPPLFAFWERPIASFENYTYSLSFVQFGRMQIRWNLKALVGYLNNPTRFLRSALSDKNAKSSMNYKVRREQDVIDILAYLRSVQKKEAELKEQNEKILGTDNPSAETEEGKEDKSPRQRNTN